VAGRVLTFADPEIIRLAREEFIPVAGDDWYQRRRQDAEGEFFRGVADQGPRKGQGGATRQGIYVFTADGKLLAYRNHHDPAVMRTVLQEGLRAWNKLPAAQRQPGAVKVPQLAKVDATYDRALPEGTLIVNVYTRILDRTAAGEFCPGTCKTRGGDKAAVDHLWLTREEWKGLIPAQPRKGQKVALPERIVQRIARFHLADNTRGEPDLWTRKEVRKATLTLTVEDTSAEKVTLRLEGTFLLTTHPDPKQAKRGFDATLLGTVRYDVKKGAIDRFDVVAVGDHWGEGTYTRGARPGRTPLGIAFELASGDDPADRVPPQGSRYMRGYLHPDKD
jgi:hypothetical protein